jgi:prophage regulatory protein
MTLENVETARPLRILRLREVRERTGLSTSSIYNLKCFPVKRVPLGPNTVGWLEHEVCDWLAERVAQRDQPRVHPLQVRRSRTAVR